MQFIIQQNTNDRDAMILIRNISVSIHTNFLFPTIVTLHEFDFLFFMNIFCFPFFDQSKFSLEEKPRNRETQKKLTYYYFKVIDTESDLLTRK